jgi:hypothetical protein
MGTVVRAVNLAGGRGWFGSIRLDMQTVFDAWAAGFQLLVLMIIGWCTVFLVSRSVEQRLRRKGRRSPGITATLNWVWDYSNVIGIPTLLVGSLYLVWAMSLGPGLSAGPTALVILMMALAALLIGFGPGLRR